MHHYDAEKLKTLFTKACERRPLGAKFQRRLERLSEAVAALREAGIDCDMRFFNELCEVGASMINSEGCEGFSGILRVAHTEYLFAIEIDMDGYSHALNLHLSSNNRHGLTADGAYKNSTVFDLLEDKSALQSFQKTIIERAAVQKQIEAYDIAGGFVTERTKRKPKLLKKPPQA